MICALGCAVGVLPWQSTAFRVYSAHDERVTALAVHPSGGVVALDLLPPVPGLCATAAGTPISGR